MVVTKVDQHHCRNVTSSIYQHQSLKCDRLRVDDDPWTDQEPLVRRPSRFESTRLQESPVATEVVRVLDLWGSELRFLRARYLNRSQCSRLLQYL